MNNENSTTNSTPSTPPPSFFLDPYDHLEREDKILLQVTVSKQDAALLRNIGEKRGIPQTTLAILVKSICDACRRLHIEDYTHKNEYEQLISRIAGASFTRGTTNLTGTTSQLQPTSGGTPSLLNGSTTVLPLTTGVARPNPTMEDVKSVVTNPKKRTDGRPVRPSRSKAKVTKTKSQFDVGRDETTGEA